MKVTEIIDRAKTSRIANSITALGLQGGACTVSERNARVAERAGMEPQKRGPHMGETWAQCVARLHAEGYRRFWIKTATRYGASAFWAGK